MADQKVGVEFTETMRGFWSTQFKDDYEHAYTQGKKDETRFEFTLTVRSADVDTMIADPAHQAEMHGTVDCPALSEQPLKVEKASFHLFVEDPDSVQTRKMIYKVPMTAADGKVYYMEGFKLVRDDFGPDLWKDTTTLFITVHEGANDSGAVLGKGIVKIKINDFRRQLTTMKAVGAENKVDGLKALAKFGKFFSGALNEVYGGVFAMPRAASIYDPPRRRRPLTCGEGTVHDFKTEDGVDLRLTRFQGGVKGPVILVPGFGTSALAFTIDTTEKNLPEYLYEAGYDVWVFDYRASPVLPSASSQFNLDDVARYDHPAAVRTVREITGAETVQIMAHCVGSLTMLMSMTLGLEGVRSAVSSQLTLHPVPPLLNDIKADLYLANFITVLGVDDLDTTYDKKKWTDRLYEKVLRLYPTKERCNNPVCHRILFMYGEVFDHDQLNVDTHDNIGEMFGVANMETFQHITKMLRADHAVTWENENTYLENAKNVQTPILFIHGENNRLFLPEGSRKTYDFLCETNGPQLYSRKVIPNYAHMDCFIGKNAARDVYPLVREELDKYN